MKVSKISYWLKEELQTFCGGNGISSTGSKIEISYRIETFLRSGEIKNPIRKTKINRMVEPQVHLSLDTFKKKIAPQF
ncbi:SAP domain-containing protein [Peribacillus simplex]|uniref:SAP domain-containing protein n=1 Tax=Peribacillus simplex TaxID=1478 RepID=UPI003F4F2782